MARAQFWALRENLAWTRTETKSRWPFDAIKARWPKNADDPIWMTALMPSAFDRPLADRWANTWEVVGLGSAKRAASRLFSLLQKQANTENARKKCLGTDEKTLILNHCARRASDLKGAIGKLVVQIQAHGVRSALTRDYGTSIFGVFYDETEFACFEDVAQRINGGGDPAHSLERVLQETRDRVARGAGDLITSYRKPLDGFAAMNQLYGESRFITAAESLLKEVQAVRDAKELQMRIDQVHKTAPQSSLPPKPPVEQLS